MPDSIEDVVNHILNVIMGKSNQMYLKNKDAFVECKKELLVRSPEINNNYIEISWEASNDSFGEAEPAEEETSWEFHYQK